MKSDRGNVIRRHYAFALRDEVPLPDGGWTVMRHGSECRDGDEPELSCGGRRDCKTAEVCHLVETPGEDRRYAEALEDLSNLLTRVTGVGTPGLSEPKALPVRRAAAIVGVPWADGVETHEHYERSFGLLRDAVKALRLATQARTPNLSIERVWPLYMILDEDDQGQFTATNVVIIEHGFGVTPRASKADLAQAERALLAGWLVNPVEIYLDFELDARKAWDTDGDYVEALLKAATAAEVLLKQTAWMLTWEATHVSASDPAPQANTSTRIFTMKPGELLGAVLSPRLKGNWSTQADH